MGELTWHSVGGIKGHVQHITQLYSLEQQSVLSTKVVRAEKTTKMSNSGLEEVRGSFRGISPV